MTEPLRIANASGFYGDRFAAVGEMLTGGEVDVLTGDYLAELTMLILGRDRATDPSLGFAKTFLRQMEESLGLAVDRGVTIVTNAGGLNPAGLAERLRQLAASLGVEVRIAHVEGDDLLPRATSSVSDRHSRRTPTSGAGGSPPAWNVVPMSSSPVGSPMPRSSSVRRPRHFGWSNTDFDALAGATVAGHVIECSAQATGGNYSFFTELGDLRHAGFPLAEVYADGSSVITKHAGTAGAVTRETVTAQLLYEIAGPRYAGPDVTTRFDTIRLDDEGPDRVRISGVRGEPPPPTVKVGIASLGGFRNEVVFVLTGLDIEAKAALVQQQLAGFDATWTLARTDRADADTEQEASALLYCVVRGADQKAIGRAFSGAAIELALASYPGFHVTAPPGDAEPYGVFTVAHVAAADIEHTAVLADGTRLLIGPPPASNELVDVADPPLPEPLAGATRRVPLGTIAGARSGDKGGSANVGVWARTDAAWRWLANQLTVDELRRLLPETAPLPVTRHVLPNLRAVNFVIDGLLGEGVASNARFDPQAKALGEWLRARHVDIPEVLLPWTPDSLAPVMTLASGNRPMNRRPPRSGAGDDRAALQPRRWSAEFAANRDAMLARLADIDALHATAVAGGGRKYTERHHHRGKLLARQRIELLLDEDAPFLELSPLAGYGSSYTVGASVVTGIGVVSGVECLISASDPTVKGGASNPYTLRKAFRAPTSPSRTVSRRSTSSSPAAPTCPPRRTSSSPEGERSATSLALSAHGIPSISIVFGNSTAGGAYLPGMSDHVVMVKERAKVFLAGPPLLKMATGEEADDESLGGAEMHSRISGLSDHLAVDEPDAIRLGRRIVARLNWHKLGPRPPWTSPRRCTTRKTSSASSPPICSPRSNRARSSRASSTARSSTSSSRCTGRRWSPGGHVYTAIRWASWPTPAACCSARSRRRPRSSSSSPTGPTRRCCSSRTPPATWSARSTSRAGSSSTGR